MATTVHCNESAANTPSTMPTNTGSTIPRGLHGQAPLQVALLGDSFTHGACVPPRGIGRRSCPAPHFRPRSISVLIARGHSPMAIFKEYAVPAAAIVVWNWFEGNDLRDVRRDLNRVPLRAY